MVDSRHPGRKGERGFGEVLRRFRLAAGLSQEALAERARLSADAISTLERGVRRVPYRYTVSLLADALKLGPSERKELETAAERRRGPRQADVLSEVGPDDLRPPLTRLIGREREVDAIRALLLAQDTRLVTLTGPGGIGKTRLAVHVAQLVRDELRGTLTAVSLAAVREPRLVEGAIASAAGVRVRQGETLREALRAHFADGAHLLVLDNFEQVRDAAPLVLDLLLSVPQLKALVTSREPLRIRGESEWALSPLDSDAAAVELFVDRARAANSRFVLDETNAAAVTEIVHRLDRFPLAIELAAPFVRVWPPQALLEQMHQPLEVLVGGPRDAPQRQRTMRDTIEWSYDLLGPEEQHLFRRLALLEGGFDIDAVEAVTRDDRDERPPHLVECLTALMDKSLLHQIESSGSDAQIGMFQAIREFALERLRDSGELEQARRRHAQYVMEFAHGAAAASRGEDSGLWLRGFDRQLGNIRATLTWARRADEPSLGLRIASDLVEYWTSRGLIAEGRDWMEAFLRSHALERHEPLTYTRGLLAVGMLALRTDDYERCAASLNRALALATTAGDTLSTARAGMYLGVVAHRLRDYERAREHYERSMPLWETLGEPFYLVIARNNYAALLCDLGSLDAAAELFQENAALARSSAYLRFLPDALGNLGEIERRRGDYATAERFHLEGLELLQRSGDRYGMVDALHQLGETAAASGDYRRAASFYQASLRANAEVGHRELNAGCLEGLAQLADAGGDFERAILLYSAAVLERERISTPGPPGMREKNESAMARLRERVSPGTFARLQALAASRSLESIIADELSRDESG